MQTETGRYDRPTHETWMRVADLLARMTLAEKVGQLVQIRPHGTFDPHAFEAQKRAAQESGTPFVFQLPEREDLEDWLTAGRAGSLLNLMDARAVNRCQRLAVENSRMGIPLLIGADVIHGLRTVFPIPLAESCTWNPELLEQAARVAAEEAASLGIDWIFAPMVDIARDPRWGRIAESAGEDPFLGAAMARARVRGFQALDLAGGRRITACPKHFAAYGAGEGGRDYNTVDISERTLRDVHLPPFKAAFEAGAGSLMTAFNEIGGVPATANPLILRTILREEWGWDGVVLSDFQSVQELVPHGIAADLREAARLSLLAGLDIDMGSGAYDRHLAELVEAGEVPLALVDQAVGRVLALKIDLGLFERPYVDEGLAQEVLLQPASRQLALEAARESVVLLKNEAGLLPLPPGSQRIAVIGPLADNQADLLGAWSIAGQPGDVETLLDGLGAHLEAGSWRYEPGCTISGDGPADFEAAVEAARAADVVVMALGESADLSGESHSRVHLGLPGRQAALFDAVAETGVPIVCVLMSGRPLVVPELAGRASALLAAWHGGIRAGRALADLLFGEENPSGKLTASWPRAEGQIPVYYGHKNTGRPAAEAGTRQFAEYFKSVYLDEPNSPLFPFGFGLSYTRFEYSGLRIEQPAPGMDGVLVAAATVTNRGERAGAEVVQLYVRDRVGSVTRPVRELKGFRKVHLEPGAAAEVRFEVPVRELGFTGSEMRYTVEPGDFKLWIGPDSTGGLEGNFRLEGAG